MSVRISSRADITLEAVRRVAWDGEGVDLAHEALERMDEMHASFMALVAARLAEDPGALIYGTTTAPGDGAAVALTPEAQARRSGACARTRAGHADASRARNRPDHLRGAAPRSGPAAGPRRA